MPIKQEKEQQTNRQWHCGTHF